MSALGRPPRIQVPRWVQLVGLPLLLVLAWVFLTAASHVVFLFLVAGAGRAAARSARARRSSEIRLPRGLSVAIVLLAFAAALALVIVAIATAVVGGDEDGGEPIQRVLHESFTAPPDRPPPTATSTASSSG